MKNNVFANGLEIACKAADGLSRAAFPDPCFTPPPPSGGWILAPYANTAYAKDLANGSTTVFISGLQVAKKDISFIKTSTGNEPAAGPMGINTGVKKGKAYFTSWSMDVKVEGNNVCRHTDTITHNHASWSGNTSNWVYLDNAVRRECKKACELIEKACGKNSTSKCFSTTKKSRRKESKDTIKRRGMKNALVRAFKKWAKKNGFSVIVDENWKYGHCFPYLIANPGGLDKQIEAFDKQIEQLENTITNLPKQLKNISEIVDWKILSKEAISAIIPDSILDLLPISRLRRLKRIANTSLYAKIAEEVVAEIKLILTITEDFLAKLRVQRLLLKGAKKFTPENLASMAEKAARKSKCIKARKCLLEPYNKSLMPVTLFSSSGCCPGQTAHHLIPDSFFKSEHGNIADCDKGNPLNQYTHGGAPTVCSEGGNATGSHGKMHDLMNELATKEIDNGELTYEKAKKAALEAHSRVFGSECGDNNLCLAVQLDNYYKKKCKKNNFRVSPKKSRPGGGWLKGAIPYPDNSSKEK